MKEWIVLGEKDGGKIKLVSKGEIGILPKGSFLTVEDSGNKFVLRVDDSKQIEPYSPSPLVAEMDLPTLTADKKCVNEVIAYRVKDLSYREDGLVDFIHPQSKARLSTQEEVDVAMNVNEDGPKVFISTVQSNQNRVLKDADGKRISVKLPKNMYYYQMMLCGKTGSGKTVAMKYLADYFIRKVGGAVLAINVKDIDFLQMDMSSNKLNKDTQSEWDDLDLRSEGLPDVTMYMPANRNILSINKINHNLCKKITLNVDDIEPVALSGLLQGISDKGAMLLPSIFNYWREECKHSGKECSFNQFVNYFSENESRVFHTLSERGDESVTTIHAATFDNISRSLTSAIDFFDNKDSISLDAMDILQYGKMSILDFSGTNGTKFGSILLRDLLKKIVEIKDRKESDVPILIIIDEVHQFYGDSNATDALDDLDTICRTGRSKQIGVMFASQNPSDMPRGLSSVINTKIFLKTDNSSIKETGVRVSAEELESLDAGFAVVQIHGVPQLKIIKFPLSPCGVVEND